MITPTATLFLLTPDISDPDLSANCAGHWNLVKHGSLRLEVRFEKALSVTINCIVYAEFDNVLKIDFSRQVIVDFSGYPYYPTAEKIIFPHYTFFFI